MQSNISKLSHLSDDHLHGPAMTVNSNPPRQPQTPSGRSTLRPDKSLAFDDEKGVTLPKDVVLLMIVGALSPYIGFCWWLMLMSFLATFYYTKFVVSSFRPPHHGLSSVEMVRFATQAMLRSTILVGMFYWCFSITPFHIFAPTAMDLWTPYRVHEALRMTEVAYDPGRSASINIFAIHGLGSMPESAWTYRSNETEVRWLSELLPQTADFQDARIVMVNHHTRWDSNAAYMEFNDHASGLLEHIESQLKANPDRPIIFIAHSFGGLLLKKALLLAKSRSKDVAAMTRGIIFLGVPHRGTHAAFVASCLSCMAFFRGSSSNLHQFMSVNGPAILDLEYEFYDGYVLPHQPHQLPLYICDVLEMRPERMGKFVLGRIVRPKRGLLRHGRVFTLDTDHRGLNKFQSHDDPNFQKIVKILLQAKSFALQPHPFLDPPVSDPPNLQNETPPTPPDFLGFLSSAIPWTISNRIEAFAMGGFQEYFALWLAKDHTMLRHHLTRCVLNTAFYECLVGVSIGQALCWLVFRHFEGCTSFEARILQIVVSNITIVPIQRVFSIAAMGLIAGARTWPQVRATVKVGAIRSIRLSLALYLTCILVAYDLPPNTWTFLFHLAFFLLNTYTYTITKKKRLAALRKRYEIEKMLRAENKENGEEGNGGEGNGGEENRGEGNGGEENRGEENGGEENGGEENGGKENRVNG